MANGLVNVLGISGSLRKASFNTGLLRAAGHVLPDTMKLTIADIGGLPLFNEDLEGDMPKAVQAFKRAVEQSDAILIATPEYNYSTSGVLKNAIDWASRPYGKNSFEGKAVAIMGAAASMGGSMRAQYHLRQSFVFLNGFVLNRPEVMVPAAHERFDQDGNLKDEHALEKIKELLVALAQWADRLRP